MPGAHEGKGLGNKFLDDLRHADALIHVVDVSGTTDAEGEELSFRYKVQEGYARWVLADTHWAQERPREGMIHLKTLFGYGQRLSAGLRVI